MVDVVAEQMSLCLGFKRVSVWAWVTTNGSNGVLMSTIYLICNCYWALLGVSMRSKDLLLLKSVNWSTRWPRKCWTDCNAISKCLYLEVDTHERSKQMISTILNTNKYFHKVHICPTTRPFSFLFARCKGFCEFFRILNTKTDDRSKTICEG